MSFLDVMHAYFRGERIEALVFIVPLGVLSLGAGAFFALALRDGFARGAGVPCLVFGLALAGVGAVVGLRTPSQVADLEARYQADAPAAVEAELGRMRKVNANWPVYLAAYVVFVVAGMAMRFALRADWAQGAGVALVFFAGVGLLVDGFAERRARPYTAALEAERAPPR